MKQINEDIAEYQERFPNITNIKKPEWAFNFWILDKLYSVDEDLVEEKIIDYNDGGIDCYVWHEDKRDLYLIQNKYFSEDTTLSLSYVTNDFLVRGIGALENGTYTRCPELQTIFTKYKDEKDFAVHFRLYVTNNIAISTNIQNALNDFNVSKENYDAKGYSLDEIEGLYYGEPIKEGKNLSYNIVTVNGGTVLNVNTKEYNLAQNIDAKYLLTPVKEIYELIKTAKKEKYPIFDSNIREYLGSSGVNKGIFTTLKDSKDRVNFFYYNNGITMIVEKMDKVKQVAGRSSLKVLNPQIINGCQTVNTIYEVLNGYPESSLDTEFKNSYVMLKILEIKEDSDEMKELNKAIVTYNNKQNAINQKTFEASASEFKRIKTEFERKGFLLCTKQSDKHTFGEDYKTATELKNRNSELISRFGLTMLDKTKDFYIELEKFLQVILAYENGALDAIQNKSKLLIPESAQHKTVLDFIRRSDVSINEMLELYLLYLRMEYEKKALQLSKFNPFYLIYCFGLYECDISNPNKIHTNLDSSEKIEKIVKLYKAALSAYHTGWVNQNLGKDYNDMIKSQFDKKLMDTSRTMALSITN